MLRLVVIGGPQIKEKQNGAFNVKDIYHVKDIYPIFIFICRNMIAMLLHENLQNAFMKLNLFTITG